MDYFKVGTFNTSKYGLSWHKKVRTGARAGRNMNDGYELLIFTE